MKFNTKYKLLLWKTYVDRGRGLTSYFNELFLLFGFWQISSRANPLWLIATIFFYVVLCFVIGWAYFKYGWEIADKEVQNRYNLFVKEMRKKFK